MAKFHGTAEWKRTRRIARIEAQYICEHCHGFRPGKGQLHVHHRKPYLKAPALATEPLNLACVCGPCHNVVEPRTGTRRIRSACDETGWPLDPEHPWNVVKRGA